MTPAARISAAIELVDSILQSWRVETRVPADKLVDQYFKARRYIGSHDRGAIAELVYWVLRHKGSLEWWCDRSYTAKLARTLMIGALIFRGEAAVAQLATLFDGSKYAPAPLTDGEWQFAHHIGKQAMAHPDMPRAARLNYPQWMEPLLEATLGRALESEMKAMQAQAPVDLRANTLIAPREQLIEKLIAEGFDAEPTPVSPVGIRLKKREAIFASPLFKQGWFEMQDEGSQIVSKLVDAAPGMRVIDFCAGAGGKTLGIAADMQNKGRILAFDTSAKRLAQLPLRLRRAQVFNTEWHVIASEQDTYLKRHKLSADRVLVDVPCSGSGTWRRNPDLKWRFGKKDLDEVRDVQQRIFASAARLVKPGGRLIYATCSLLKQENHDQVEEFLKTHSNFRVVCAQKIWNKTPTSGASEGVSYLSLTPQQDGVDGFFAAALERTAA